MLNPSSTSSTKTYRNYPHWPAVSDYADYAHGLGAVLVVLYGSVARGEFQPDSDADVLVLTMQPMAWKQVYQHTHGVVQPVIKTIDEYLAHLQTGEPFFVEMIEDGVVLYDGDGWYRRLLDAANAA